MNVKLANMGCNNIDTDASVSILMGELSHWILSAAIQDGFGNWDKAQCFLDRAEAVSVKIGVLQTRCDTDISSYQVGNVEVCDLSKDRGIGNWAIPPGESRCGIFKIRKGITPPPYGEFKRGEFVLNEFTKEVTE